jgi:hypothetical protein
MLQLAAREYCACRFRSSLLKYALRGAPEKSPRRLPASLPFKTHISRVLPRIGALLGHFVTESGGIGGKVRRRSPTETVGTGTARKRFTTAYHAAPVLGNYLLDTQDCHTL